MKTKFAVYLSLLILGLVFIETSESFAQKNTKKEAVLWNAEDIKWGPMPGAPEGVMSTMLWGDQTKGAYGGLTKFPAGFKTPLHYHTNDIKMVVIKGAYIYNGKSYGPGSYLFIPGGDKHESAGIGDSESIFFIEQSGKFDLNLIESAKEKN